MFGRTLSMMGKIYSHSRNAINTTYLFSLICFDFAFIAKMVKLERDFLLEVTIEKHKSHLVNQIGGAFQGVF